MELLLLGIGVVALTLGLWSRRRGRLALDDARERYRALSESAFDLVAELDPEERFTYVNPRFEEVLGYPRASFLGRTPAEYLDDDYTPAAAAFADEASETGRASGLVVQARHADGHTLWLECVARAFVTRGGERRWVMNCRDVSDRQALEELQVETQVRLEGTVAERTVALRESEARFRALADQAPELISEFDEAGRYTFANASFRELLGLDPSRIVGTRPQTLIHPDDLPDSRDGMTRAMREEGTTEALHRLRHADGSWRWFENTGRAYRTANGALRFVSIGRDVTEARAADAERQMLQAQMEERQRLESLGLLAGGIAHDFNNLLAVILGNLDLLESPAGSPDVPAQVRRIRSAAEHAEALTDQMLTYAGKSVRDVAPLDLSKLVAETEDLLRASVSKQCRLELQLAAEAPAVRGDPTQLRQVLFSLVTNASDALGAKSGLVRVTTGVRRLSSADLADGLGAAERPPGVWLVLEVSDDGAGMEAEVRRRIFEPFFTTKDAGRGLGLAAALGIASAHGGVLKLQSALGAGTTFQLLLPPAADEAPTEAPLPAATQAEARNARILVVDDDDAVREVAQALLERGGFRVESAAGGEQALARIREGALIDAVLLDLEMPEISGADVLRAIQAERPGLPVVVSSGYKRDLAAERVGEPGPAAYVQKPYDPEPLLAALDRALATSP